MRWENLKNDECPKCGYKLEDNGDGFTCENDKCNFYITNNKYDQLLDDFNRNDRKSEFEGYGFE